MPEEWHPKLVFWPTYVRALEHTLSRVRAYTHTHRGVVVVGAEPRLRREHGVAIQGVRLQ